MSATKGEMRDRPVKVAIAVPRADVELNGIVRSAGNDPALLITVESLPVATVPGGSNRSADAGWQDRNWPVALNTPWLDAASEAQYE